MSSQEQTDNLGADAHQVSAVQHQQANQMQSLQQQQAMNLGIQVDNSALVLTSVQNQLQGNICMLGKPEVVEIRMMLGIKIDNMLGVAGVDSFSEYVAKVTEKAKEGACLIKQRSSNSTTLSMANFGIVMDTLVNLVNSKAFALEMSSFLRILCGSVSSSRTSAERKFWRVQRMVSNGDIEISIVALEVVCDNMPTVGLLNNMSLGAGISSVELKIDMLQYGVPGDLVSF